MNTLVSHVKQYLELSKALFLARQQPLKDELLSSWLVRTARAHKTMTTSFTNMYFPEYSNNIIWQRDLDIWAPENLIQSLVHKSGLEYHQILEMTLKSYEGILVDKIRGKGRTHFIQTLGNFCHIKKNGGLRFCPECLTEDKVPYFRKYWRLSFYTACEKHRVFMLDRCSECGEALTISKAFYEKDYTYCYKCGNDLKLTTSEKIPENEFGINAIQILIDVIKNKNFKYGQEIIHAIDFFRGLRQLNKMIYLWEYRKGLVSCECGAFGKVINKPNYEDHISIKEQYYLYSYSMYVISNPMAIKTFICENNIKRSRLKKDAKNIFWIA